MIQSALSKAQFNTKKKAVIQSLNLNGTANIKINGVTYNNIKIRTGLLPQVNEVVWVEIPNNNFSDAYIDSAKLVSGVSEYNSVDEYFENVTSLNDIYSLSLSSYRTFMIEPIDINTKTVEFINIPSDLNRIINVSILLTYTYSATINFPETIVWDNISPVFEVGKKYILDFTTYNNGLTWNGLWVESYF